MVCYHCGSKNKEHAAFCAHCGRKMVRAGISDWEFEDHDPFSSPDKHRDDSWAEDPAPKKQPVRRHSRVLPIVLLAVLIAAGIGIVLLLLPDAATPGSTSVPPTTQTPTEDPAEAAYRDAEDYCAQLASLGEYDQAIQHLLSVSRLYLNDARYDRLLNQYRVQQKDYILDTAAGHAASGQYRIAIQTLTDAWNLHADPDYYEAAAEYRQAFGIYNTSIFAAGKYNSIFLLPDGTVRIIGENDYKELNASNWTDITAVSAGDRHVVGLRSDNTVVARGEEKYGQCDVSGWQDVIAISAGDIHTVGLTRDGRVLAAGYNHCGQRNVASLMQDAGDLRIVSVSAGYVHTLALLEDGTVVACGGGGHGETDVYHWTDIAAIYTGTEFSAGLRTDGTVVVAGYGTENWNLSEWTDIVNLAAGDYYLIGLKADGSVLSVNTETPEHLASGFADVGELRDIVFIAAGNDHTVALDRFGMIHCIGSNKFGQCAYSGIKLYD